MPAKVFRVSDPGAGDAGQDHAGAEPGVEFHGASFAAMRFTDTLDWYSGRSCGVWSLLFVFLYLYLLVTTYPVMALDGPLHERGLGQLVRGLLRLEHR